MNYKVEGAIRRNRANFIIFGLLWLLIAIVFVAPLSYAIHIATAEDGFNLSTFLSEWTNGVFDFKSIGKIIEAGGFGMYIKHVLIATVIYSIFFFIGMARTAPKNRYTDMEHGSSDWSQRGEQYQILNKNQGIILAENNYLPVDKRGNVNVLVVGRFGFTENLHHIQYLMLFKC